MIPKEMLLAKNADATTVHARNESIPPVTGLRATAFPGVQTTLSARDFIRAHRDRLWNEVVS